MILSISRARLVIMNLRFIVWYFVLSYYFIAIMS